MTEHITLESLANLGNGSAGVIANREIRKAIADLEDRGEEDGKPRKVTIEATMVMKNGIVVVDVAAKASLPPHRSYSTACEIKRSANGAELLFQPHNAERADQGTIFDEVDGEAS